MCSPAAGHNHPHYANYARYELTDDNGQAIVDLMTNFPSKSPG